MSNAVVLPGCVMMPYCNPGTEAEGLQAPGWPRIYSQTLSQNKRNPSDAFVPKLCSTVSHSIVQYGWQCFPNCHNSGKQWTEKGHFIACLAITEQCMQHDLLRPENHRCPTKKEWKCLPWAFRGGQLANWCDWTSELWPKNWGLWPLFPLGNRGKPVCSEGRLLWM